MIHDNILIAHELLHYLQSSKNGPNKGLVVKLDMSKAYDRVEWNFIEKVMKKMGFEEKWIAKIMECVRSVTYTVKCNNILSDIFIPERGLRQGDPLSPYLFLFCMEAFSRMLIHAQENNTLRGIRASRDGPRINHLFFADDALLFVRNKRSDIECLVKMLTTFSNISGQEINFEKSMVLFSPNTPRAQRTIFSDLLGMPVVEKLNNYLGLPIPIGKKKTEAFKDITNRLSCRINSWIKRLLSFGGKEVFIKAVLQSIPTYAMSIFLAPKGVIEDIQAMLSRTWWSGKEKGRFWTMIQWKTLCKPKDSLCFKVLSSKYFPDGNIFHAKKMDKASFTWSSIATAVDVFKDGFGWRVGNGEKINIRADNWGMEGLNGDVVISNTLNQCVKSVKDLWHVDRRSWDVNKVKQVYGQDWSLKICDIPIGDVDQEDKIIWFHNIHGCFTSKSAYSWILLKDMGYGPHRFFWRALWKLDTLPKIRVFTWCVGHEVLPTNGKIASIRPGFNKGCPRCGAETETLLHALRDCPTSREVLSIGGWSRSFISKLGKEEKAQLIWERASNLSKEFRICNMLYEPLILQNNENQKWIKPPKGFIKINFDATVGENRIGYGTVVRDEEGFVVGGGGGFKEGRLSVEEAECVAFKESINVACKLNLREDVLFETDNAGLVNRFNNLDNDVTILGAKIKECTAAFTIFKSAKLCWTERSCISVAHLICKKMLRETKSYFFDMDYPSKIHDAVICDVT
ncbi:hypothetical protein PVK06_030374 [Gossypium arboreum]|uniref:Reverse transcriptase domain-containing protein n=1 Tax=Gossypium arboreum TaxID=29729 RepID=A0ABR0NNB1_GOSAR|nr:hypothetical protein PVK06_030374 [Gossypium arboreum]